MANAWVVEWPSAAIINNNVVPCPYGDFLRIQKVAFTGTAGTIDDPIGDDCGLVQLYVDTAGCWSGGDAPTATVNDAPIAAHVPFFLIPPPKTGGTRPKYSFIAQA